jgi:hypothetical protein
MNRFITRMGCLALTVFLLAGTQGCTNQAEGFQTPEQAVGALMWAVRNNDKPEMLKILGSDAREVIVSGDEVADENARERFLQAYDQKHRLMTEPDGSITLVVGNNDWPMPIPLVRDQETNQWYFDTEAGRDEMINRRVGRNELDTIQTCLAIVDAQREYATMDPNGDGVAEYAETFLSDPGKKNGLFWKTAEGEPLSPLGELAAEASAEGYARGTSGERQPYHGYFYRMLKSQGASANGGAYDYVAGGRMIGGFAVVAWPADYGASGVKTFMTSHDGVVYERDLGDNTDDIAKGMNSFDPGPGWDKVQVIEPGQ